jgi:hypothetical protein
MVFSNDSVWVQLLVYIFSALDYNNQGLSELETSKSPLAFIIVFYTLNTKSCLYFGTIIFYCASQKLLGFELSCVVPECLIESSYD